MAIHPVNKELVPPLRRSTAGKERTIAALRTPIADEFTVTHAERRS